MGDGKKWGIMVYMAADNDLSQDAIYAIGQIQQAFRRNKGKLEDVEFFLYFDGNAYGFPSLQFDFKEAESETNPIRFNREYKASPDSIYRFVQKCAEKDSFKNRENYALIVSCHGFGFQEDSLLKDEASHSSATVQDLADNIGGLNKNFLGGKLKVLGFDSCVMNSLEVACELRKGQVERMDFTNANFLEDVFLVSSEGYVPSAGWNYSGIIDNLAEAPERSPAEMAKLLVDCYINEYEPSHDYSGLSLDIAAFSLSLIEDLTQGIHKLGKQLLGLLETDANGRRIERAVLNAHSKCQTYLYDQCVDIKDFCDLLLGELTAEKIINEDSEIACTLEEISRLFVCQKVYSKSLGKETQFSNGMSLYFPWSFHTFLIILHRYRKLEFGRLPDDENSLSGWGEFLWYYLSGTMRTDNEYRNGTRLLASAKDNGSNTESKEFIMETANKNFVNTEFSWGIEGTKINPPDKTKINPPDNTRINPPDKTRLGNLFIENFRRTHNFPWLPEPVIRRLTSGLDSNGTAIRRQRARG